MLYVVGLETKKGYENSVIHIIVCEKEKTENAKSNFEKQGYKHIVEFHEKPKYDDSVKVVIH